MNEGQVDQEICISLNLANMPQFAVAFYDCICYGQVRLRATPAWEKVDRRRATDEKTYT